MANDPWALAAQALVGGIQGYQAKTAANEKHELEQKKLRELVLASNLNEQKEGYTRSPDGNSLQVNPNVFTPDTPEYKLGDRMSELKRLSSGASAKSRMKAGEAQRLRNAFGAGTALSPEDENIEIDPGLVNLISPPKPMAGYDPEQLVALGIISAEQGAQLRGTKLPSNALTALKPPKPPLAPGASLVKEYEADFGPGSSANIEPTQLSAAVQRSRDMKLREKIANKKAGEKNAEAGEKKAQRQRQAEQTADIVIQDVDRALEMMRGSEYAVGPYAGRTKVIPGTPAYNLDNLLDTIRANISFDKLQAMREASPTGGALGQVSDFENRLLQSTLGKLDVTMDPADFEFNLNRLREQYAKVINEGIDPSEYAEEPTANKNPSDKRAAGRAQTKSIGGKKYRKVPGGWELVK